MRQPASAEGGSRPRGDGIALLEKACDVLEAVGASRDGLSQAELSARLGLPRTTLYRILSGLVGRGLLRQDASRRVYAIGFRLLEITGNAWSAPDLPAAAAPELRALRDATGETAYVAVLDGREAVALGKFEGAHEVRSAARLGIRKPLHCTSQGKAILAFLPDAEREPILRRLTFTVLTPHTIADRRQLEAALHVTRGRGFAVDDEEIAEGVRCVGAPVLDPAGRVLGAVSIAGPAWRMTLERLALLGPEVAAAGRRIGAAIRSEPAAHSGVRTLPPAEAFHGTAACWSVATGQLWWADRLAPAVFSSRSDGVPALVAEWPAPVLSLVLTAQGGCLVADATGTLALLTADGAVRDRRDLALPGQLQAVVAAPDGGLCIAWDRGDRGGAIGRLPAPGRPPVATWSLNAAVSALAFGADGALFAACAETGAILRLEAGRPAPLLLTRLQAGGGRPGGLAIDVQGGVWTALHDGWGLARLSPDGAIDRVLPLPVPRPTSLAFGGPDLRTLFVTSARDGLGLDVLGTAPLSGRLFALETDIQGVPQTLAA